MQVQQCDMALAIQAIPCIGHPRCRQR